MYYDLFDELLRKRGLKTADVVRGTGIDAGTFTHWKKGQYTPKKEKLDKIASFLGVPSTYWDTKDVEIRYYTVAPEMAEELKEKHRVLMDAVRDVPEEDIDKVLAILKAFRRE